MRGMPFLPQNADLVDPNLVVLKWDVVFEVLATIIVLSFLSRFLIHSML
jgi:hypothetical protein